ncbi:MAG TPA: ABC transporter substrate-binding protein [Casimicrobiaceae bacterium]|nr:ABC transporter substrate-binding protein [Casimicrobiaceae bacterium]
MMRIALLLVAWLAVAAPAHAADPNKVLHVAFPVAETGFDPQATSDLYSDTVQRAIFEAPYGFDYLARPYKRVPRTASAMPEITDGGRVWVIHIKPGLYFADDPAFKGKKRELTAADYVYSWKRLLDPRMRSPFAWYLQGKIVGADAVVDAARKTNRFDYDAPIPGLRALDRYTIRLELKEPDYILMGYLCSSPMAAVAREVVEAYGDASGWVMANPVGTGPYRLKSWRRGVQIVLEANPNFRIEKFPDKGDAGDDRIIGEMKGKTLPQIGRIEISIIEESNPRLLAFDSNALDFVNVPSDLADRVLEPSGKLRPEYAARGVRVERLTQPSLRWTYFNMEDPVVGGYAKDRIALRRAIAMAFNVPDLVRVIYQGQAEPATQLVPPGMPGYDPKLDVSVHFDLAGAKALLDKFGYVDRDGDGWRDRPDGKPLVLSMGSATSGRDRDLDEIWARSMKALGVRIEFVKQKWPDLLKMGKAGQLQMWNLGWINAYAEGDAFVQLLFSDNIGQTNYSRFHLAEYDALYRKSRTLPDGPERNRLYRRMSEIEAAYTPWVLNVFTVESTLVQPWLKGYKKHAYWEHAWEYLDTKTYAERN